MATVKRIALLMGQDHSYCRGVLRGIHAYAVDKTNWLCRDAPPDMNMIGQLREWKPHGIIAHLFDAEFARRVRALKRPLVNVTSTFLDLPVPLIDVDSRLAGRLAAAHLMDRGFRNFGYFGSQWTGFSKHREEGFREALAAAGHGLTACHSDFLPRRPVVATWNLRDRQVRDWLLALTKPVAILASNDYGARRLAEFCHHLNFRVPEDVALLGIDNDELECLLSRPPLSSVVNPTHKIGFEAARMLDQLMSGRQPSQTTVFVPPAHVVTRQSTDIVAVADADVSAALAFISVHATESIGPADVVKGLAIARRALELRFRKLLGRSMLQEIQRVRIERAKRLLAETNAPISAVASRCGFSTQQRLAAVFRQVTGEPATSYRQRARGSR
jgi:LacI family transcriptional regulator